MDPATIAAIISALGGLGISMFSGGDRVSRKQRRLQKKQGGLIDDILMGLQEGSGPFADLFSFDEQAFQNRVADPLLNQFNRQTAPQIQQKFISSGQQRGTPMETALTRGGMSVQDNINKLFQQFQQQGQQNALSGLGKVLGFNFGMPGAPDQGINPILGLLQGFLAGGGPEAVGGMFNSNANNDLIWDLNTGGTFYDNGRRGF